MKKSYSLIAPCGMNCGVCYAYLRKNNKCPGCRMFSKKEPVTIYRCKIRNCTKKKNLEFCFQCPDFPCDNLKHLDKRYRTKYNMSEIENLEYIRDNGIKAFLEKESAKWKCNKCSGVICAHKGYCLDCVVNK